MKTVSKSWIYKNLKTFNNNKSRVGPIVQSIIKDIESNGDKKWYKNGKYHRIGISPPEYLGEHFKFIRNYLEERGVKYKSKKS